MAVVGGMNRVKEIVEAKKVYQDGYTGKKVRIALLDTGAYMEHPDLKGKVIAFRDFVHGKEKCYDDNGHGTHISGILCGNGVSAGGVYAGMAPGAELVVMKVLDHKGNGSTEDVLKALDWILENKDRYRIRLLNFSVGFLPGAHRNEQENLLKKIETIWDEGIMVVTAAGNNGPGKQTITVPGISRKVVTVGASDDDFWNQNRKGLSESQEYGRKKADMEQLPQGYSGRGPTGCCIVKPEILAPGTQIKSLSNRGKGYTKKSGTSMAAPVVCGALALAFEKEPRLTPAGLKLCLHESVVWLPQKSYAHAWGLLQVDKLMNIV